jgi:hypothetical protein
MLTSPRAYLQAATQDAIDLEANLSRLLERAEAEKAELGERASLADQARQAATEAALLQGRERARDLEIELGIAQRNADFRLQWLQVWPSFSLFPLILFGLNLLKANPSLRILLF